MNKEDSSSEVEMHPEVKKWYAQLAAKAGSTKTLKKAEASRKNGLAPCHQGKFRGRPRKKADDKTRTV